MTHPWEGAATPPATAAGAPCASCSGSTAPTPPSPGTNGAFLSLAASGVGVSASITVDSHGDVYISTGHGVVAPSASVAVGTFHSKGAPDDFFVGESTCVNGGTEGMKVGGEVCKNASGNSAAVTFGPSVLPYGAQTTYTTKALDLKSFGNTTGLREPPARRGAVAAATTPPAPTTRVHGH